MNDKSLSIAVIGCGGIAQHAHLPAILRIPQYRLLGVSDPYPEVAARVAALSGLPESAGATDHRPFFRNPAIDAVIVCAPTTMHADIAVEALEAGKHVLVEKPMAVTTAEAQRMNAAAAKAKRTLMVAFNHTYDPATRAVRAMIDAGELGDILFAEAFFYEDLYSWTAGALASVVRAKDQKSFWPKYDSAFENLREFIHNFGSHVLNAMRYLLGDPRGIDYAHYGDPATFLAVFDHGRHKTVFKNVRIKQHDFEKGLEICGSKKRVRLDFAPPLQRYTPGRLHVIDIEQKRTYSPFLDWVWPFEAEHRHFAECVLTGKTPISHGGQAIVDVELAETLSRKALGL